MKYSSFLMIAWLILVACPTTALGQESKIPTKGKLAGKVSSLIPRTRRPVVAGKKRDFTRLIKDKEQHDALMAKLAEPLSCEARDIAYERKLNRYGAAKSRTRALLSDFGAESDENRPRKKAVSAKEPEDDSGDSSWFVLLGIFLGSGIVILRARS